jgi:endonuclease YncB( thermonuclease family)
LVSQPSFAHIEATASNLQKILYVIVGEVKTCVSTIITCAAALVLLVMATIGFAGTAWSGKVVGVTDGDTIKVPKDGKQVRIRLFGIDCPERRQLLAVAALSQRWSVSAWVSRAAGD